MSETKNPRRRAAERTAKAHLSHGYFQGKLSYDVYAFCPWRSCHAKIETVLPYGQSGAGAAVRNLVAPIADHIEDFHPNEIS